MKRLIGKSLGNVVFTEQNGNLYGNLTNYGVNASYLIKPVSFFGRESNTYGSGRNHSYKRGLLGVCNRADNAKTARRRQVFA